MDNYLVEDLDYFTNVSHFMAFKLWEEKMKNYDLTFVLSGELIYNADGETIVLKKNDAMLLPPGTVRIRKESNVPVTYVSFNFTLLPGAQLPLDRYLPNRLLTNIKTVLALLPKGHLTKYYNSKAKITNILNYILLELMDDTLLQSSNRHVHNIVNYIEEHITEKMSLQSISMEIGLTKEYTASIFKKETKHTVTEYINERKIYLAKELIIHNEMSLNDIARYLNFENYNYFSRLFKHYVNLTPSALRKQNKR